MQIQKNFTFITGQRPSDFFNVGVSINDDAIQYLIDIEGKLRIESINAFIGYFLSNWIKFVDIRQITMDPKLDMYKEA